MVSVAVLSLSDSSAPVATNARSKAIVAHTSRFVKKKQIDRALRATTNAVVLNQRGSIRRSATIPVTRAAVRYKKGCLFGVSVEWERIVGPIWRIGPIGPISSIVDNGAREA